MKVIEIAVTVEPLNPGDMIAKALAAMIRHDVDIIPVSDHRGAIAGVLTRKDLLAALGNGAVREGSINSLVSGTIPRLSPEEDICNLSSAAVPAVIMRADGSIVGVVSSSGYAGAMCESVREFRERITAIMDSAESGIAAIDESGTLIIANRMAGEIFNIDPQEVIGRKVLEIYPKTKLVEVMKSGKPLNGQKFTRGKRHFIVNYAPVLREDRIVGAVSIFHDFSLFEQISDELSTVKSLNRELGAIIHSSYDGIWITDGEGFVLDINEAYERITGIRKEEVIGRTMQELVEEGFFDQSVTLLVMKELKNITINQTVKGKKQILVTGNPIFDEGGNLFRVVTNVRDITELVNLQEQLTQEKEKTMIYRAELTHLRSLQIRDSEFIFRSKEMTKIVELAVKMADVDSTILITGESGTGKELVAKFVHRQGKGDGCPFISINCAAIPEQLMESELFGYEGGAFTGARREGKPGLFELAHNGTLFLDEIAELPLTLQVKLLRAIQDREITRVGATKGIPINVRIIAATNRDLARMLREETFREDLYYRLMVVPIHVPPLRDRREDIPLLIYFFLAEFNRHFGYAKVFSPQILDKLVNYPWPGNVRELKNVMERMIVMSPGMEIGPESIPEHIYTKRRLPKQGARLKDAVEETERYLIEETYREYRSWQKAAEVLGVDRTTVFRKAVKYGVVSQFEIKNIFLDTKVK